MSNAFGTSLKALRHQQSGPAWKTVKRNGRSCLLKVPEPRSYRWYPMPEALRSNLTVDRVVSAFSLKAL